LKSALAYVGAFSYGLYLLHQPYVAYLGERMRRMSLFEFIAIASLVIAGLAIISAQAYSPVDEPCSRRAVEHTGCASSNPVVLT
jgi:peptidoglycan/LPS O-acetylase OafA/YrhL